MPRLVLDDCSELEIDVSTADILTLERSIYECDECSLETKERVFHNVPDTEPDEVAARAQSLLDSDHASNH